MSFHSRGALHPITLTAFSLPACSSEVGLHVSPAHFRILWGIFSPPKPGDGGGDLNPLCGGCLHCQLAVVLGSPLRETSGCV